MPEVSVIIPVYNSSQYIKKAIDSVLVQNITYEIIVVDDNSSDNLHQEIATYESLPNFIYIKNPQNMGVAISRNIGVKNAKGRFIAFLDADDWWQPDKLTKQISLIKERDCALCYTARKLYTEEERSINKIIFIKDKVDYNELLLHNTISCSSVLMKREIAIQYPMEHSKYHEDYITWLRILKGGNIAYGINEPLLNYRLSKNGKSRNKIKSARMTFGVYRILGMNMLRALGFTCSHLAHSIIKYTI